MGAPPAPHDLWTAWSLEPTVLLGLGLAAGLYGRGLWQLWQRAGSGRGLSIWRASAFALGWAALVAALISPVDALGQALFAAHMLQHMLLMIVAAPLLVLGTPTIALLWALPPRQRRQIGGWWRRARLLPGLWRGLSQPLVALALHAGLLWLWHLPGLYQAALQSEAVHLLEHASFLGSALLFWWVAIQPAGPRRLSQGVGALVIFIMALQGNLLGALMTFTPRPWYPAYASTVAAWGLTPLEDQQLAGLIMWIPAGLVYVTATLLLLASWLQSVEKADRLAEQRARLARQA